MKAKATISDLPNYSFLIDKQSFYVKDYFHSVALLSFGYYDENGKFNYIYHLLIDDVFTRVFTVYLEALIFMSKLA